MTHCMQVGNAPHIFSKRARAMLAMVGLLAAVGCKPDAAVKTGATIQSKPESAMAATKTTLLPAMFIGAWQPYSKTAMSITGAVTLNGGSITIQGKSYPVTAMQPVTTADASIVNDALSLVYPGPPAAGFLAQTSIPAHAAMLNGNTLCSGGTTWVLGVEAAGSERGEHDLGLAFFSGDAKPQLTKESLGSTSTLCGTFSYSAP